MPEEKRKLPRATLEQKIKILDYYHASKRLQLDTVDKFKGEVAISTSAFNEWLKNEEDYRERYQLNSGHEKNSRRKVTFKYDKINRAMDLLVEQRLSRGEAVTEPILRNYWQIYAHQFGVDNPKRLCGFSHGWLGQFKKRHGLLKLKASRSNSTTSANEKLLADPVDSINKPSAREELSTGPQNLPQDSATHFQPQETLSFPQKFSYLLNDNAQRVREQADPLDRTEESLQSAMQQSRAVMTALDIEYFIFNKADHFFKAHQYDYPQTLKIFQEFKSSFLSERLIDLRSSKEPSLASQIPQQQMPQQLPQLQLQDNPLTQNVEPPRLTLPEVRHHSQPPHKRHLQSVPMLHAKPSRQLRNLRVDMADTMGQPHRYARTSHTSVRVRELLQKQSQEQPAPLFTGSQAPQHAVSGEQSMDELFLRQGEQKQQSYAESGEWSKSALRKIWEQNKMMLS